ncbi:MAG: hypothetical protein ACRDUW_07300 [Pseudonocardiaceae bacterium]
MARIDDPDVFAQLLAETRLLRRRFVHTAPRPWDAVTASAELSVHLGHLARCLLRYHDSPTNEWDDPARPLSDIGDELADVLRGILGISASPMLSAEILTVGWRIYCQCSGWISEWLRDQGRCRCSGQGPG